MRHPTAPYDGIDSANKGVRPEFLVSESPAKLDQLKQADGIAKQRAELGLLPLRQQVQVDGVLLPPRQLDAHELLRRGQTYSD